jgi:hypothetical protein
MVFRPVRAIFAVIVAVVPLPGASPTAQGSPVAPCAPEGAAILAADRAAQIYDAHLPDGTFAPNVYGCTLDHKHRFLLAHRDRGECRTVAELACGEWVDEPVALAATTVAYLEHRIDHGSEDGYVVVRSLRTDHVVHVFKERFGQVVQLVVKADGALAWVEALSGGAVNPYRYAIGALDRNGYRQLAESFRSELRLLGVRGSTLTWELDGQRATAPLH